MKFKVILATDNEHTLGVNGGIPWNSPEDMNYFRKITSFSPFSNRPNILICGRKTWETMKTLKLPGRTLHVVSRNAGLLHKEHNDSNVLFYHSFEEALSAANHRDPFNIWVIGGKSIYVQAFHHPDCGEVYWNRIQHVTQSKKKVITIRDDSFRSLRTHVSARNEFNRPRVIARVGSMCGVEIQYLRLMKEILLRGEIRSTRNATTYSLFGRHLQWNLQDGFPLLTTKRMFWKGIVEELLFFIRGDTQTKLLEEKGVNIWKGNTCRAFLDANGHHTKKEGQMGPMYGYQWRHFGTQTGSEIDQLSDFIQELKSNPNSRRHLLTTYNPAQVHDGVLFPCHSLVIQAYIDSKQRLSMEMYQRSADVFLGLPFNIASTSLLCHIIAQLCGLDVGMVGITIGDAHIYESHTEACNEQLQRESYPLCNLKMMPFDSLKQVEQSKLDDFELHHYSHHPSIKVNMVA